MTVLRLASYCRSVTISQLISVVVELNIVFCRSVSACEMASDKPKLSLRRKRKEAQPPEAVGSTHLAQPVGVVSEKVGGVSGAVSVERGELDDFQPQQPSRTGVGRKRRSPQNETAGLGNYYLCTTHYCISCVTLPLSLSLCLSLSLSLSLPLGILMWYQRTSCSWLWQCQPLSSRPQLSRQSTIEGEREPDKTGSQLL